jgi:hypothetical protein
MMGCYGGSSSFSSSVNSSNCSNNNNNCAKVEVNHSLSPPGNRLPVLLDSLPPKSSSAYLEVQDLLNILVCRQKGLFNYGLAIMYTEIKKKKLFGFHFDALFWCCQ